MEELERRSIITRVAAITGLEDARAEQLVAEFEIVFAKPFSKKLLSLRMKDIIKNKNPYLYRASGIESCQDIVRRAWQDYVSSSVEGFFGPFFESVARVLSGGVKPARGGEADLDIRQDEVVRLYAIKSGAKGFNSSSEDKARRDLNSAEGRLRQDRLRTEKKIAFAYGRKKTTFKDGIERLASKQFWAEISGDPDFYRKLLEVCGALAPLYTADMAMPFEDLLIEAHELFCEEGVVNWDKVLALVSG